MSLSTWIGVVLGVLWGAAWAWDEARGRVRRPPTYWNPLQPLSDLRISMNAERRKGRHER